MRSNRPLILLAAALLLAALIAGIWIRSNSPTSAPSDKPQVAKVSGQTGDDQSGKSLDGASKSQDRAKNRRSETESELVAKYGESRTNLSKHAAGNIVGILDDAVQMGELIVSGKAGGFGGNPGFALGRLFGDLNLTPEQSEKSKAIFQEYQNRQIANQKNAIERLQKDPTPLMKLMLASDAGSRGEMSDEEYKQLQMETGKQLMGVINPLDRKNFGGGSPLRDQAFVAGFRGILDQEQAGKLDAAITKRETDARSDPGSIPGVEEGNIAGLPKMELEKIDQSIESARKITTGIKSMMDGFGGLKDVIPPQPNQGGN